MKRQSVHLFVVAILALLGPLAQKGRGDFVLYDNQRLTVNSSHSQGILWDTSRASIVTGGIVYELFAGHSSTVDMSGGDVEWLRASCSSDVYISGGGVSRLDARDFSIVDISGGSVNHLYAWDSSVVDVSGGNVGWLDTWGSPTVSFYGQNFRASGGLTLYGDRVLGTTGLLAGEWFDGTPWVLNIGYNYPTATILAVPALYILTIDVDPNDVGIDTVTPDVGTHSCGGWVSIKAERFVNCPDVYQFDHWEGDVTDPNSSSTTINMDANKSVTAVFVDERQCGDECHPYPIGDLDKDCEVTFGDFALFASHWLDCTKPECD